MILEDATHEAFGYYPSELKPQSAKPILAACTLCGAFKLITKNHYCALCISCVKKGRIFTEEWKANLSAAKKGEKHPMFNMHHTEETKALMSAAKKGEKHPNYSKQGKDSSNYKGGKKAAAARAGAKRDRELGYTLLMPLAAGEHGHHVTDEHVIGIPADVHISIGGSRKKHRTLILQWLKDNDKKKYNLVIAI